MIVPRDPSKPMAPARWFLLAWDFPTEHMERIAVAMRLSLDVDACVALLEGRPVDPARLDAAELERAKSKRLVRLDVSPLDVLGVAA